MIDSAARPVRLRRIAAVAALVASVAVAAAGFLPWLRITDPQGHIAVTGWGRIGGDSGLAGMNINEVLEVLGSSSSYRPAQFVAALMAFALAAALVLLLRASQFAGAVLLSIGAAVLAWGAVRVLVLGEVADVLIGDVQDAGPGTDATAGLGPWVCAAGGLVLTAVGLLVLLGRTGRPRARG